MREDQYGHPLPDDLHALYMLDWCVTDLEEEEVKAIMDLKWYIVDDHEWRDAIFVSAEEYHGAGLAYSIASAEDLGVDLAKYDILRVADPLKRFNSEDGFYNA